MSRAIASLPWLALLALAACGQASPKGGAAARADAAPAQPRLHVVVDGRTVPMQSAVAVLWSDGAIKIQAANHELRCDEALQSMRTGVPADDVSFSAHLEHRLATSGDWSWVAAELGADIAIDTSGTITATVGGDLSHTAEVTLRFGLDAGAASSGRWRRIDVDGTVAATVCGPMPVAPDHPALPRTHHPSTAKVTIAGQRLPLEAAWRYQDTIYFSSEPSTCAYAGLPTRLALVRDRPDAWKMEGGWIGGSQQITGDGQGLSITAGKKGDSPDGPTVVLAISGSAKLGDYPLELSGTIEALDCKERK